MTNNLYKKLENIALQAQGWKMYGVITPVFFIIIFFSFHLIENNAYWIMVGGWALFFITCLIWWFWTIRIFVALSDSHLEMLRIMSDVSKDMYEVKQDVKIMSEIEQKRNRQSK
jgi:uncharacterized membrane protein